MALSSRSTVSRRTASPQPGNHEVKVELAKSEERLRNLQARLRQFDESRQERQRAIDENREQLRQCLERAANSPVEHPPRRIGSRRAVPAQGGIRSAHRRH